MCRSCWSRARVLLVTSMVMLGQGMPAGREWRASEANGVSSSEDDAGDVAGCRGR